MVIEITAETYNAWVLSLEGLAAKDPKHQTWSHSGEKKEMTPATALHYLEQHAHGDHENVTAEDRPPILTVLRRVATGETTQLGDDYADDDLMRQVIANAERLTGIKAQYPPGATNEK